MSSSATTRHPVRRLAAALGLHPSCTSAGQRPPAARPASATDAALPHTAGDELTASLARLHDEHVEQVNAAVGEGREDLLQELSDSYVEEAMTLMAAAGLPPARAAHLLTA